MGYNDLRHKFKEVRNQYNVMAVIGNGFDIQALTDLSSARDTRYESFYDYLGDKKFNASNRLFKKMGDLRRVGAANWSDVEGAIEDLLDNDMASPTDVATDLKEIQHEFSSFLDQVATPDILATLGDLSVANRWAMTSFTNFLGDIGDPEEYNKMLLPTRLDIGDLFNFQFVNFNYTTLLDDYVYLDQIQFDPHPYQQSDRNINFHPNPRGHAGARERAAFHMVSYLVADVVHPHGIQYTPRSLLFGIDSAKGMARKLTKPYWAQNDVKYGDLFADTNLFIIFGCSLGKTDGWWWRTIARTLIEKDDSELILYWRRAPKDSGITDQDIRDRFANAADGQGNRELPTALAKKARIVLYDDTTQRAWLNTNPTTAPSWSRA